MRRSRQTVRKTTGCEKREKRGPVLGWKTAEKKKRSERSVRSSTGAVFEAGSEEPAASGTYLTSERFSEQLTPPTAACAAGTPSRQKEPLERAARKSRGKEPWERSVTSAAGTPNQRSLRKPPARTP